MKEVWKPIKDFPGYEVSNLGRVKSYRRNYPRILSGIAFGYGYLAVILYSNTGRGKKRYIHHLVLETFVGPCPPSYQAHHKDNNKSKNFLENLEWITAGENRMYAFRSGAISYVGSRNPKAKLNEDKVKIIRDLYASGTSAELLASRFGIARTYIYQIIRRKCWHHI